jgi:gliding motility-associated-like protein
MLHKRLAILFLLLAQVISVKVYGQNFVLSGSATSIPTITGSACQEADTCFTITPNQEFQLGAVWSLQEINLSQAIDATFCIFLGTSDSGADGIAFLFRKLNANLTGAPGGGLGFGAANVNGINYTGVTPSVAFEFDTYFNSNYFDIAEDHTQLIVNAAVTQPSAVPAVPLHPSIANQEDNQFHTVQITWNPDNNLLSLYFDGIQRIAHTIDLINTVFNGDPIVNWGFTGSTGGMTSLQQVCFPTLSIHLPDQITCVGDSVLVNYFEPNLTSYQWTDPQGNVILNWDNNQNTPLIDTSFYATLPGTYTLEVSTISGSYTGSFTLINENLTLNLGNDTVLCEGTNWVLDAGNWQNPIWNTTETTNEIIISQPGEYSIAANSSLGCTYFDTIQVDYVSPPSPFFALAETACSNAQQLEIDSVATILQNITSIPIGVIFNASTNLLSWQTGTTGTFTIEHTTQDPGNLCSATWIETITIHPNPLFNPIADIGLCQGEVQPQIDFQTIPNSANFVWNVTSDIGFGSVGTDSAIPTFTSSIIGSTEVSVSGVSEFGCASDTNQFTISVAEPPILTLSIDTTSGCSPLTTSLLATSNQPINSLIWNINGTPTNTNNPTQITLSQAGFADVTVTVNSNNCIVSQTWEDTIEVFLTPTAAFTYLVNDLNTTDFSIVLIDQSENSNVIEWFIEDSLISTQNQTTTTFINAAGTDQVIQLIAYNGNCSDTSTQVIALKTDLLVFIPNTFSPDGDEFNSIFRPVLSDAVDDTSLRFTVRNRWGEVIFETNDRFSGWDGIYLGNSCKTDIYVWNLSCRNKFTNEYHTFIGHILLLR